jgi:general secretion pathway protein G
MLTHRSKGFSFIELLAVLVILGLIAAALTPTIFSKIAQGKIKSAKVQMSSFDQALNNFNLDCGFFPATEQGLDALINPPTNGKTCKSFDPNGYFGKKKIPQDPWGEPYVYASPGQANPGSYDLSSAGPDKSPGTEDDIKGWE